jgi:hypothetical protein
MAAGVDQDRETGAWLTTREVVPDMVPKFVESVGVKVTLSVCVPAARTVPAAGEYVKVPATGAPLKVALALSWAAERAVP